MATVKNSRSTKHSTTGNTKQKPTPAKHSKGTTAAQSINKHLPNNQLELDNDDDDDEDDEPDLDLNELLAMKENFELDLASHLRTLRLERTSALSTINRQWKTGRITLADQLVDLPMRDFVDLYGADENKALKEVVERGMEQVPMGEAERQLQSRRLKRAAPSSPSQPTSTTANNNANRGTAKKHRPTASSPQKPSASSRGGAVGTGSRVRSPTAVRSNTSNTSTNPSSNFIYRQPSSSSNTHPHLPPTPSIGAGSRTRTFSLAGVGATAGGRRPRRGESIIMQSVNGSPLGEVRADDLVDDGAEEGEDVDGDGGWDLMEKFEASRVETQGKGTSKAKGKGKATSKPAPVPAPKEGRQTRSRSSSLSSSQPAPQPPFIPASTNFNFPQSEDLEKQWKENYKKNLMDMLEKTEMSKKDRERLRGMYEMMI